MRDVFLVLICRNISRSAVQSSLKLGYRIINNTSFTSTKCIVVSCCTWSNVWFLVATLRASKHKCPSLRSTIEYFNFDPLKFPDLINSIKLAAGASHNKRCLRGEPEVLTLEYILTDHHATLRVQFVLY